LVTVARDRYKLGRRASHVNRLWCHWLPRLIRYYASFWPR